MFFIFIGDTGFEMVNTLTGTDSKSLFIYANTATGII
jgi:hypothetical protein